MSARVNKNLFTYLTQNTDADFTNPESEPTIENLEKRFNVTFPEDYKDILLKSRSMEFHGEYNNMRCFSRKDIIYHNTDDYYSEGLKGLFIFGADGGGNMYAYDPDNLLKKGPYSVFWGSRSDLSFETLRFLGSSLTEVAEEILQHTVEKSFFSWKKLNVE